VFRKHIRHQSIELSRNQIEDVSYCHQEKKKVLIDHRNMPCVLKGNKTEYLYYLICNIGSQLARKFKNIIKLYESASTQLFHTHLISERKI
jgi:hypothetical protein